MTTDLILVRAKERGISFSDFEIMTVGMILDYIITYNNLNNKEDEEESTIEATQSHFDSW